MHFSTETPTGAAHSKTTHKTSAIIAVAALMAIASFGFARLITAQASLNATAANPLITDGINFGQGSWAPNKLPGVYNTDYTYAPQADYTYYQSKGVKVARIAFLWERVQYTLNGALNSTEIGRLQNQASMANAAGMLAILDVHNYGMYNGQLIGSSAVPYSAFANFWGQMANAFKGYNVAYGIMNEPHDSSGLWFGAVQPAINAIRQYDTAHPILVPTEGWTSCWQWANNTSTQFDNLSDPSNNWVFECHVYFDDNSGQYNKGPYSYYHGTEDPRQVAHDYIQPFLDWLSNYRTRTGRNIGAFVGETGVPDNDQGLSSQWGNTALNTSCSNDLYLCTLDEAYKMLSAAGIGSTYWTGGPWDSSDALNTDPRDSLSGGTDRPQMPVMTTYTLGTTSATSTPTATPTKLPTPTATLAPTNAPAPTSTSTPAPTSTPRGKGHKNQSPTPTP